MFLKKKNFLGTINNHKHLGSQLSGFFWRGEITKGTPRYRAKSVRQH